MVKNSLGRGLSSLIPKKPLQKTKTNLEISENEEKNGIAFINVEKIIPNPHQPRRDFNPEKIQELSDSIKEHGILEPLIVSKKNSQWELIAGARRLEAAKKAGLKQAPAIIREVNDEQKLEIALVENIQRDSLNPIEEAYAYQSLSKQFDLTQEKISQKAGKSRTAIANTLRLLSLPLEIQKGLISGKISEGHGRVILSLSFSEKQRALYQEIVRSNLTVRQTEEKAKKLSDPFFIKRIKKNDPDIKEKEELLSQSLETKVSIQKFSKGGKIVISFYSREELENLIDKIAN
jgi:ParB family chromosome partitioning protein